MKLTKKQAGLPGGNRFYKLRLGIKMSKLAKYVPIQLSPRSHGLVVRVVTREARGPGFDSSS